MVYLEHSGTRFWACTKTAAKTVTTTFGKCGSKGRTITKDFETIAEAKDYIKTQEASKRKVGYIDAKDPNSVGKKRKKSQHDKAGGKDVSKKAGLKNHSSPDLQHEAVSSLDSGVAGVDAALASRAKLHEHLHAKLALVDPIKNSDKYYIIQVLVDEKAKKQRGKRRTNRITGRDYYLFCRWGRTGTAGQAKLDGPFEGGEEDAEKNFSKVFKGKTGVDWSKAIPGASPKEGKYEYLIRVNRTSETGEWYYYLENDPLGKPNGWYKYDEKNIDEAEVLYSEFVASNGAARLSTRLVHSETSGFTYEIDLKEMTQTNKQSGRVRPIQRSTLGTKPTSPPTSGTPPQSPVKQSKAIIASSPAVKSTPTAAKINSPTTAVVAGKVDPAASGGLCAGSVYGEYDVMLNQTNLRANNNKFYKIQLVQTSNGVYLFTKWGRVGEAGATQELGPMDSDKAIAEFMKKFRSKTGNTWDDRDSFEPKTGKYSIVEMESDSEACIAQTVLSDAKNVLPCKLDPTTKALVDLIFDKDMFKTTMSSLNLDPSKLPLGALSKAQIRRGFDVLERLEAEIDGGADRRTLEQYTSEFYTTIPHAFGRRAGPVLKTKESVQEKYEMLNTLTDIETAQSMQKENSERDDHPSDLNYQQLCADLTLTKDCDKDRKIIEKYLRNTKGSGFSSRKGGMKLRDVWRVNRQNESARFAEHDNIDNRRLLWHGTSVAVVAAILKSGLRIMPHSGGRVGQGIYLADQHEKSAWYVSSAQGTIIMFLVEAALGKQHEILEDDWTIKSPPKGFDSVLAKGKKRPNEDEDVNITIDGMTLKVPQGRPKAVQSAKESSFEHNEFLIYKESQHRIRYILTFDE